MTRSELSNEYFDWMCQHVCKSLYFNFSNSQSYHDLLLCLHGIDFTYTIPMDDNRATDGINLRYKFGDEMGYDQAMIALYLDDAPCSVLEMLIALSIRCEESFLGDPELGNRTGVWFWEMISNLKLYSMCDGHFDKGNTLRKVNAFMNHEYKPNGEGGLFVIEHPYQDLRSVEIWCQMCWHLDEILYGETEVFT